MLGSTGFTPVQPEEFAPAVFGVVLYSILVLWSLIGFVQMLRLKSHLRTMRQTRMSRIDLQIILHGFILLFSMVRTAWVALEMAGFNNPITFIINRIAFLFFFSLFTFLVFYWAESYHQLKTQGTVLDKLRPAFLITNAVLYVMEVVFIVCTLLDPSDGAVAYYDANIYIISALSLIVSIFIAIYGLLNYKTYISQPGVSSEHKKKLNRIPIVAIVISLCFMVRAIGWGYRLVTNNYLDVWTYLFLLYYVPESIPVVIHLLVMRGAKQRRLLGSAGTSGKVRTHVASSVGSDMNDSLISGDYGRQMRGV